MTIERSILYSEAEEDINLIKTGETDNGSRKKRYHNAVATVISVGSNNSYSHPNREVLARLQFHGCNIWQMERNGTVETRMNQYNDTAKTDRNFYARNQIKSACQGTKK